MRNCFHHSSNVISRRPQRSSAQTQECKVICEVVFDDPVEDIEAKDECIFECIADYESFKNALEEILKDM